MSAKNNGALTRRNFMKLSGAAAVIAAAGGPGRVLHALVSGKQGAEENQIRNMFSACDMCFNKCGLIARVEGGVVKKLDPNPKSLKSRGMLCARGNAGVKQLYDPDRLKYPLLRKGTRGEGKWQRLSWDEALDHAAEQLDRIGKEYTRCGFLFMAGTDMQSTFVHHFAEVYGSYNVISHESNCLLSRNRAFLDTFGVVPTPDVIHSKYIIMPGANRFEALVTPDSMDLMTTMQAGSKLVVLDPRFTKTAALADEWFAIKPGTDMAFFLAIAHVLISEGLYDKKFMAEKTAGFDELRVHVQKYTPEWAARETDIPARDIRRLARELAADAPSAMVYPGRRSSDYKDSTQIRRSYAIVNALLGNWDQKGGLILPKKIKTGSISTEVPFYEDNPDDRVDAGRAQMMFDEEGSFKHTRDAVIEGKPFKTRSKKIELYSERYEENGIDPMPVYHPPKNVPENRFRIVVGRNAYITQSASTNNALLWELEQENSLWIHPDPAQRLGIRLGDTVEVKSPAGKGRLKARVTEDTRPDTVYMDTGFGVISKGLSKIYGKGACIAEVLVDEADDISGNMAMHETIVSVRKV